MNPIYVEQKDEAVRQVPVSRPAAAAAIVPVAPPQLPAQIVPVSQPMAAAVLPVSGNSLEILVSPVALYPDTILRDLFRATSRPYELFQANLWVHQVRDANGSLPPNGYNDSWDPSVKAMTAYPDLLQRLTTDAEWMARLGTTYVAQPVEVMNAVQRVRVRSQSVRNTPSMF
jgi:hypothetical protein